MIRNTRMQSPESLPDNHHSPARHPPPHTHTHTHTPPPHHPRTHNDHSPLHNHHSSRHLCNHHSSQHSPSSCAITLVGSSSITLFTSPFAFLPLPLLLVTPPPLPSSSSSPLTPSSSAPFSSRLLLCHLHPPPLLRPHMTKPPFSLELSFVQGTSVRLRPNCRVDWGSTVSRGPPRTCFAAFLESFLSKVTHGQ
jgi:hypothetical protein